jgi:hypothetical protein
MNPHWKMRTAEGFSLIEPAAFTIDHPAAATLLAKICRIAALSGEKLSGAGNALAQAMTEGVAVDVFLDDVLDRSGRIEDLAKTMDVPADMLSLLFYLAAKPSIEAGSRTAGGATAHRSGTSRQLPCVRQRPHYRRAGRRGQPVASLRVLLAPLAGKAAGLPVLQQPGQRFPGIYIQR